MTYFKAEAKSSEGADLWECSGPDLDQIIETIKEMGVSHGYEVASVLLHVWP